MTPSETIRAAQSKGVRLVVADGKLICRGNRQAVAHLIEAIRRHKTEIIRELIQVANDSTDRLVMRCCPVCDDDTQHQLIDGRWECTRLHPNLILLDLEGRTGPWVTCYTPSGHPIRIKTRDEKHAEWLRKMNPPPVESGTKSNQGEPKFCKAP